MDSISPTSLDLARQLLAKEASRGKLPATGSDAPHQTSAALVCHKLQTVLTTFAGVAGFRSLLRRALTLAAARVPDLKAVTVLPDGSLSGVESVASGKKLGAAMEWEEVLIAQLLDLLVTFVGEGLMQQMVKQAWPDPPGGRLRSRTEN